MISEIQEMIYNNVKNLNFTRLYLQINNTYNLCVKFGICGDYGRRSASLGTYCLKRLPCTCTVVIVEHGVIVFDKQGSLKNEEPSETFLILHFIKTFFFPPHAPKSTDLFSSISVAEKILSSKLQRSWRS